jgi:uncharacterized membrane protein YgcG
MQKHSSKLYLISAILLLLISAVAAKELYYDSGASGAVDCIRIAPEESSVMVRFTPDVRGPVKTVRIIWTNLCSPSDATSGFKITLCSCGTEVSECADSPSVTDTSELTGKFQDIDVSSLNFNATVGEDFCVQVDSQDEGIYVLQSGTGRYLVHYYNYGLFDPYDKWNSFSYIQTLLPNIKELAIRAVISTPSTTTTLPSGGGGGSGGSGEGGSAGGSSDGGGSGGGSSGGGVGGVGKPAISCFNGIMDQNETDIDCGGPCAPCISCSDGIQNQGETGIDCGGPCAACSTTTTQASATIDESTMTTIGSATTTTTAPEVQTAFGFLTGLHLSGVNTLLLLLLLSFVILIYIYKRNIGGKK